MEEFMEFVLSPPRDESSKLDPNYFHYMRGINFKTKGKKDTYLDGELDGKSMPIGFEWEALLGGVLQKLHSLTPNKYFLLLLALFLFLYFLYILFH